MKHLDRLTTKIFPLLKLAYSEVFMLQELDVVMLTRDVEEHGLPRGSRGAVVHCYADGQGFEVEFLDSPERDAAVLTLTRADLQLEPETVQARVIELLGSLPAELVAEVRDFAEFLHHRHSQKLES